MSRKKKPAQPVDRAAAFEQVLDLTLAAGKETIASVLTPEGAIDFAALRASNLEVVEFTTKKRTEYDEEGRMKATETEYSIRITPPQEARDSLFEMIRSDDLPPVSSPGLN